MILLLRRLVDSESIAASVLFAAILLIYILEYYIILYKQHNEFDMNSI